MPYNGRREILVDYDMVTPANVREVLDCAMEKHKVNRQEIMYLYDYYRGITPILKKTKEVRESINHKVNVNRAYEIISFKLGYAYGEPIKYIAHGNGDSETVAKLNDLMMLADKTEKDTELALWGLICGIGYRMVLPSQGGELPFELFTLHPANTFIIKRNDVRKTKLAAVTYIEREDGTTVYSVYTPTQFITVEDKNIRVEDNLIGIPIIEYPENTALLGAFEPVLDLLDAISSVESMRIDDVEQTVNSFLALLGGQIDEDVLAKLEKFKMLCMPDGVDAKYISKPMQQSDMQVLVNSLYQQVLTIVGMPNRNGGTSTSDTGTAVVLRDGWSNSETQAKISELLFKSSEREFLKVALDICRMYGSVNMQPYDVEVKFSRHNTENMASKTAGLATMINSGIAPAVAIATSELWSDPNEVWEQSKPYFEKASEEEVVVDEA